MCRRRNRLGSRCLHACPLSRPLLGERGRLARGRLAMFVALQEKENSWMGLPSAGFAWEEKARPANGLASEAGQLLGVELW